MGGLATLIPAIGEIVSSAIGMLGSAFTSVFDLLFTTADGATTITTLGYFILIPVGMAVIAWALRFITKLVNGLKPKN